MKKTLLVVISITVFIFTFSIVAMAKTYDLVLLHGLTNKHQWSDAFLNQVASIWGSGNVYVIFTNESTRVWTRTINGRVIYFCGENDFSAGDDSVEVQKNLMRTKIVLLQNSYGLSSTFNLIAHSMGGLVGRRYAWAYPYTIAGFVTLGTPHHGSALAYEGDWIDFFIGADAAVNNLKPSWVNGTFNVAYPTNSTPLAGGRTLKQIVGDGDGWDCWGWAGELSVGWPLLCIQEGDNDGAVSHQSARLDGIDNHNDSTDVKFFWSYDHYDLVREASVATQAATWCP